MDDDERISGGTLMFRFLVAFVVYFCVAFVLRALNITSPWIHVLVLIVIYMLSTVSLKKLKTIWGERIAPLVKDNDNEQR